MSSYTAACSNDIKVICLASVFNVYLNKSVPFFSIVVRYFSWKLICSSVLLPNDCSILSLGRRYVPPETPALGAGLTKQSAGSYKDRLLGSIPGAYEQAFGLDSTMHEDYASDVEETSLEEGVAAVGVSKEDKARMTAPWNLTLIVKTFKLQADLESVLRGGPWFVGSQCLAIRQWELDFIASSATFSSMLVWVRLPELPIEYYEPIMLRKIGQSIRPMLRIDAHTISSSKGRFTKLCIQRSNNDHGVVRDRIHGSMDEHLPTNEAKSTVGRPTNGRRSMDDNPESMVELHHGPPMPLTAGETHLSSLKGALVLAPLGTITQFLRGEEPVARDQTKEDSARNSHRVCNYGESIHGKASTILYEEHCMHTGHQNQPSSVGHSQALDQPLSRDPR
nr:hypothetical protein CFP56_47379 [Quercus suber]